MGNQNILHEIEEEEKKQLLAGPALRLSQKLLPLQSKDEQTAKRWFWELLQNASDYNETVDVRLELDDSNVIFKHNGNPFSINDVLNLISPQTGKDEGDIKKKYIGQFGSGLVSTHILSSEIEVEGAFKAENNDKLFKFKILLDRSFFKETDWLINSIESTKKTFRETYKAIQKSDYDGFMTSFFYNTKKKLPSLTTSIDIVSLGLEQIYDVLPYTLCFMSKVQSVEIIDKRKKTTTPNYIIKRKASKENIVVFETINDKDKRKIEFVKIKHEQVETVYRHENGKVLPLPKDVSKIFCGLPMIGSELVGLPFILNSFDFEPTIEREGVEITPNDTQNRKLFTQAVKLYQLLMNDIAQKQLDNAFHHTKLSNKYHGVEESKNIYRRDYLPEFKKTIEKSNIVKNKAGNFISFSEMLLPYKDGKTFPELYQYAVEIKHAKFPSEKSYEGWVNATDFNIFPNQKYDLSQFLKEITQTTQVQAFVLKSSISSIDWLQKIVSLINEEDESLFNHYAIFPNQKGSLKKKNELYIDKDIPSELKSIFNKLNVEEIEIILVDKAFNEFINVIEKSIDTNDICKKIDNLLKEKYTADNASTANFTLPLNDLYKWFSNQKLPKKDLEYLFSWFYPRRATLFMDTFGDNERDYAFTIVQSGKIKALAALAESAITSETLEYLGNNPEIIAKLYILLQSEIDDNQNANSETGDVGEQLVYDDLRKKYKKIAGYEIIWSSKNGEAKFDFEVKYNNKTILYVDAKTTMRGISNSDSIPFFMRNSQWEFLPSVGTEIKYLIARVFKNEEIIKYLQINLIQ